MYKDSSMTPDNKHRGDGKAVYKEVLQDEKIKVLYKRSYTGEQEPVLFLRSS